ncbi:putative uncharacterized protein DDB_G0290989 [Ylistrum balloti]|uniref:putative uncharacterized protein DDB_G0290989 n=1 Tax=Ylistrum balloti TaxID=509963 RepID=UPI002905D4C9|nr:putative uncharacterized protein DDB_G0290989 [Ylistrum balloti]
MQCTNLSYIITQARNVINIRNLLFVLLVLVTVELVTFNPTKCAMMGSLLGLCSVQRLRDNSSRGRHISWIWANSQPEVKLPLCPLIPPTIVGKVPVTTAVYSWESLEDKFHDIQMGGRYRPTHCTARHRVAIILPFRDREIHLKIFLNNLHPFLQKQQLDYAIFIVDLMPEVTFNRAMLLNIGFTEALKLYDYQCFIFHDVDLIPEMGHNMYSCPENPRHMSVAIDTMHYRLPYNNIFGGVVAMTKEQFKQVNGFSNKYFGWGGEDDDMFNRIRHNNMSITRYPGDVSRYKMLSHKKEHGNPNRFHLLQGSKKRWQKDGLNSLKYSRVKLELRKLYTYLLVDIDEVYIMSNGQYNRSHQLQHQHRLQQQFDEQNVDQQHIAQIQKDIQRIQQKELQKQQQKQRIEEREKQKQKLLIQNQEKQAQNAKQIQQTKNKQLDPQLNQHVQQNLHQHQPVQANIELMKQNQQNNQKLQQSVQQNQQQIKQSQQILQKQLIQQNQQQKQQPQQNQQQKQQQLQNQHPQQNQQLQQNQQPPRNQHLNQQLQQNQHLNQQPQQNQQQNQQPQQNRQLQQNQHLNQQPQQNQQQNQQPQQNRQPQQNQQQNRQPQQNRQQNFHQQQEVHKIIEMQNNVLENTQLQIQRAQQNSINGVIKLPNLMKESNVRI